jgi:hypothetical protein
MKISNLLRLLAVVAMGTGLMYGQATRTWVSGVGDDANPCSRTAPCKTFAGAISKTAAGGEIDALDPAGFGALTITKAITIDGGGGIVASVLVSGTNGIVVQAGANDVVILRNLMFNGISSGLNGVRFLAGKELNVENCFIFGFTQNGIDIALNQSTQGTVHVLNTVLRNNAGVGIKASNALTPPVQVGIAHSTVSLDTIGVEATTHSRVAIKNSIMENASGSGVQADSTTADAQISMDDSDVSFNVNGITGSTGGAVAVANTKVAYNSGTAMNQAGGFVNSYGTNRVHTNTTTGTFTTIPQQ